MVQRWEHEVLQFSGFVGCVPRTNGRVFHNIRTDGIGLPAVFWQVDGGTAPAVDIALLR